MKRGIAVLAVSGTGRISRSHLEPGIAVSAVSGVGRMLIPPVFFDRTSRLSQGQAGCLPHPCFLLYRYWLFNVDRDYDSLEEMLRDRSPDSSRPPHSS